MKIIIVDDEIISLQLFLTQIINNNKVEYKFFKDNEDEILKYIHDNKIDACFLDINMPNINGIELAKRIINHNPDMKIIFVTGLSTTINDLDDILKPNTLGFIYKPYDYNDIKHYINIIGNTLVKLEVTMFNSFDCFINGNVVNFSSSKSKELFALLLTYDGKILEMNDAISQLWPDKDIEKSKKLYRDAVWRLRKTLDEIKFNCVTFKRGELILNKNNIECDYWDYLKGNKSKYNELFCKSYDWAIDYSIALEKIK